MRLVSKILFIVFVIVCIFDTFELIFRFFEDRTTLEYVSFRARSTKNLALAIMWFLWSKHWDGIEKE